MRKQVLLCLCLLAFLQLLSVSLQAQVHLGSGQSFANIEAAANSGSIHPGDTVYVHAGSYTRYQSVAKLEGTADKWIVICPYKNEQHDISGTWQFMSCRYIKFLRLNFKANAANPGRLLSIDNSGSCLTKSLHITVDSCTFSDVSDASSITAFKMSGVDSFLVTNNLFRNLPVCDAMDFNVCHDGLIRGNTSVDCMTGGHIKGGSSNIQMDRNLFLNSAQTGWVAFELGGDTGAQFYCPSDSFEVKNLRFFANIIVGGFRGLALSSAQDCQVVNNTFYNCSQATLRYLSTSSHYPTVRGNLVANNIFAFGSMAYINGSPQTADAATMHHNIYYSIAQANFPGPYWDTPALDALREHPTAYYGSSTLMFVNPSTNDFHLVSGSPASSSASSFAAADADYYGRPYPTSGRSAGAVQYGGTSSVESDMPISVQSAQHSLLALYIVHDELPEILRSAENINAAVYDLQGRRIEIDLAQPTSDIATLHTGYYIYRSDLVTALLLKY